MMVMHSRINKSLKKKSGGGVPVFEGRRLTEKIKHSVTVDERGVCGKEKVFAKGVGSLFLYGRWSNSFKGEEKKELSSSIEKRGGKQFWGFSVRRTVGGFIKANAQEKQIVLVGLREKGKNYLEKPPIIPTITKRAKQQERVDAIKVLIVQKGASRKRDLENTRRKIIAIGPWGCGGANLVEKAVRPLCCHGTLIKRLRRKVVGKKRLREIAVLEVNYEKLAVHVVKESTDKEVMQRKKFKRIGGPSFKEAFKRGAKTPPTKSCRF